jgi:hypothetical protein
MNLAKQASWEELEASRPEPERLGRWVEAYIAWLEGLQAQYSQSVWEDAHHAWKEFNSFV